MANFPAIYDLSSSSVTDSKMTEFDDDNQY